MAVYRHFNLGLLALVLLLIGTFCALVALATERWYEYVTKATVGEYQRQPIPGSVLGVVTVRVRAGTSLGGVIVHAHAQTHLEVDSLSTSKRKSAHVGWGLLSRQQWCV